MKLKMFIASFMVAGFTGTALANDLSHTITLNASVGQICSFANSIELDGPDLSNDGGNLALLVVVDTSTSKAMASNNTIKFGNSFCNTASNITFTRTAFQAEVTPQNGFANEIDYEATVTWGANQVAKLPLGGTNDASQQLAAPQTGVIDVNFVIPESLPLVSGVYQSIVTLAISAS